MIFIIMKFSSHRSIKNIIIPDFKLMDLIGMDVNLAVSQSLYDAFEKEERFKPSAIQKDKVANGELGRKTGKGFYQYAPIP